MEHQAIIDHLLEQQRLMNEEEVVEIGQFSRFAIPLMQLLRRGLVSSPLYPNLPPMENPIFPLAKKVNWNVEKVNWNKEGF